MKNSKTDAIAMGKIISIENTTVVIMGDPQLRFTFSYFTSTGDSVTAVTRRAIPVSEIPDFKQGELYALRYKVDNPSKIKLLRRQELTDADVKVAVEKAMGRFAVASGKKSIEWQGINENGVNAKGVILRSRPTGRIIDGLGQLELTLEITRPEGSKYKVATCETLTHEELLYSVTGRAVNIKYDRNDEQNILISFHE